MSRSPQPTRAGCGPFVELWHPESPGGRVFIRPSFLRRLGIVRSEFATLGEVLAMYRDRRYQRRRVFNVR
jgi:hypothetical protein